MLRILAITNIACLLGALLKSHSAGGLMRELTEISSFSQPLLLLSIITLYYADKYLRRLPHYAAISAIFAIEWLLTAFVYWAGDLLFIVWIGDLARYLMFTSLLLIFLLWYFALRNKALSPALTEARLQALQARIRPHFLFNSINGVLGLIRSDPRRAESALEDLADLFRVLMKDNKQLTTLQEEVELCRQYLELEKMRLGERLQVEWHIEKMPNDALIPPLVLQPLLENAVYHGIEPSSRPGVISINIYRSRDEVHAVLKNPYSMEGGHHAGNKMALDNIRERLLLHFDSAALIRTRIVGDSFQAHITWPYVKEKKT